MMKKKTQIEIGDMFGVSQGKVSSLKKQAEKEGLLAKDGTITEAGMEFLKSINIE